MVDRSFFIICAPLILLYCLVVISIFAWPGHSTQGIDILFIAGGLALLKIPMLALIATGICYLAEEVDKMRYPRSQTRKRKSKYD